jgi:hypothetical protein
MEDMRTVTGKQFSNEVVVVDAIEFVALEE